MIPARKSASIDKLFLKYIEWYVRRSFHTVYLLGDLPQFKSDGHTPLIVCMNHSSWWDVMIGFFVEHRLFAWDRYAVMDALQLQRYMFFTYLGVIGVDRSSLSGAREFLDYTGALLKEHNRALWLTPQGEMVSNYSRPMVFQPGVAHLAARVGEFYLAQVTIHYEFWNEPLPEAFVSISPIERISLSSSVSDRKKFLCDQQMRMERQLDRLLVKTQARDASQFQPLIHGKTGISTVYDAIRSTRAKLRGEAFSLEHGEVVSPQWKQKKTKQKVEQSKD